MAEKRIPKAVIARIPVYLSYLRTLDSNQFKNISSTFIAKELSLGEVQVRKDLNLLVGNGKPKIGYDLIQLLKSLEEVCECESMKKVVLIGAGHLGSALLSYKGFEQNGFKVVAAFDMDQDKVNSEIHGITVYSVDELKEYCINEKIDIAILCTPNDGAQELSDLLVESGISGIMNFTSVKLKVPKNVGVMNVDIASLLSILSLSVK